MLFPNQIYIVMAPYILLTIFSFVLYLLLYLTEDNPSTKELMSLVAGSLFCAGLNTAVFIWVLLA